MRKLSNALRLVGLSLIVITSCTSNMARGESQSSTTTSPANTHISSAAAHSCTVDCVEPHANCAESQKVIDTLKLLVHAYSHGDLKTYEEYLDNSCTTFDEGTKKLVVGKQACLEELKAKFARYSPTGETPLISITIEQPYAKVTGNTAVVTFRAVREVGGKHPIKEIAEATDVFVKDGDKWKKLHFRGRWKKAA